MFCSYKPYPPTNEFDMIFFAIFVKPSSVCPSWNQHNSKVSFLRFFISFSAPLQNFRSVWWITPVRPAPRKRKSVHLFCIKFLHFAFDSDAATSSSKLNCRSIRSKRPCGVSQSSLAAEKIPSLSLAFTVTSPPSFWRFLRSIPRNQDNDLIYFSYFT